MSFSQINSQIVESVFVHSGMISADEHATVLSSVRRCTCRLYLYEYILHVMDVLAWLLKMLLKRYNTHTHTTYAITNCEHLSRICLKRDRKPNQLTPDMYVASELEI